MSRVLLFVDRGRGPKVWGGNRRWDGEPLSARWDSGAIAAAMQKLGILEEVKKLSAEWWLVECENADDGRRLIDIDDTKGSRVIQWTGRTPNGRILASGGKP